MVELEERNSCGPGHELHQVMSPTLPCVNVGAVSGEIRQGHGKGTWHQMGLNFISFHFNFLTSN